MALSAKEAADAVGMTKQGVIRAISKGKLSATKNAKGQWEIEPVELFRVYQPVSTIPPTVDSNEAPTPDADLRQQLALLAQRLRDREEQLDEMRDQRDAWQRQAEELARTNKLLTDKQAETTPSTKPNSWWSRLFGGGE